MSVTVGYGVPVCFRRTLFESAIKNHADIADIAPLIYPLHFINDQNKRRSWIDGNDALSRTSINECSVP